jgi:gluconolactonase
MTFRLRCCLFTLMLAQAASPALAQEIQRLDPSIDKIVPANAKLERVATGFNKWTEGPVWTREGTLLFAEIPSNNIIQWAPGQAARVFMHPSGYTGTQPHRFRQQALTLRAAPLPAAA